MVQDNRDILLTADVTSTGLDLIIEAFVAVGWFDIDINHSILFPRYTSIIPYEQYTFTELLLFFLLFQSLTSLALVVHLWKSRKVQVSVDAPLVFT